MRRLVLVTRASRTSLRLRGEMVRVTGSTGVRRGDRRYKGLDAVDHCLEANGGEEVEGMLSAGQLDVDDGVGGGVSGSLGEGVYALRGGERVLVTVDDKKRRRAAFGVVERRGRQRPAAGDAAVVAVEPHDRCHGRVGLLEPRLEGGVVHGEARERR